MKRTLAVIVGALLLLGASYYACANSESELERAKQVLTQNLNIILQATHDQGFIDGYRAGFQAAKEQQTDWNNTHS